MMVSLRSMRRSSRHGLRPTKARLAKGLGTTLVLAAAFVPLGSGILRYSAAAASGLPGVPRHVKAIGTNTAINVSWKAPINEGGSPITEYWVYIGKRFGCNTAGFLEGPTACSVTGLTNGMRYAVRVFASNGKRDGDGPFSKKVNATPTNVQDCSYLAPYANLQDCDLNAADLSGADLEAANLSNANLTNVNFSNTNLDYANLSDADLSGDDVTAYLISANLSGANLTDADLSSAGLGGVSSGGIYRNSFFAAVGVDPSWWLPDRCRRKSE